MTKLDLVSMIPASRRRRLMIGLLVVSLIAFAGVAVLDAKLSDNGGGTIAFEVAGSESRAGEIVAGWERAELIGRAGFINGFDYLYALLYAATIGWACLLVALHWRRERRYKLADAGVTFASLAFVAAAFDWVENTALVIMLLGEVQAPWPQVAIGAAIPKFSLIALSLGYALYGGFAYARSRRGG